MKQKLKNEKSRNRILQAALVEFGTKNYNSATLNNICSQHGISKGLIYHYYDGKDELFLICVKECFDKLANCLKNNIVLDADTEESIKSYFQARNKFFEEKKEFKQIFMSAVLQPPIHLKSQIKELHKKLIEVNHMFAKSIFEKITLRQNVTPQEAMDYFIAFEEFFGEYFGRQQINLTNSEQLVKLHENTIYKIFDMMLYGIAKQEETL
ncbi:TetR/AcrR family transcriptional regulator [Abyssisolibacter fermentans]|uniref:TetR/AcrR family transcriptional regulator n=1 Tax=Abyssisolibacter fermentans TaxID=1766203 RepID=UPI00082BC47A|nr:TetR/AcrR family transcriptional regulator [Abyssisolibacter fermentans]